MGEDSQPSQSQEQEVSGKKTVRNVRMIHA